MTRERDLLLQYAVLFEREEGRPATVFELMLMQEAIASVALDKGDGETIVIPNADDVHPPGYNESWESHEGS